MSTTPNKLAYQEVILRAVINSSPDLISYKDYINTDGMYFGCNNAFEAFVGRSEEEIIGRTDEELFGRQQGSAIRRKDRKVLESGEDHVDEFWGKYPDGRDVLFHTRRTLLRDDAGTVIGLLTVSRDMTKEHRYKTRLEESERRYKELANTDELTGIPNRRLFFEIAEENLQIAKRENTPLSVLMMDLDNFKTINDSYGHLTGDQALRHVVSIVTGRIRQSDIMARYAGDEFVVLLHNTDGENAKKIAQEIKGLLLKNPLMTDEGIMVPVTLSIGVVMRRDEQEIEEILKRADDALYLAKHHGRNRVELICNDEYL